MTEPSERAESQPTPPSLGRRILGWVTESVLVIVGAVVIATLIRTFLCQMFTERRSCDGIDMARVKEHIRAAF